MTAAVWAVRFAAIFAIAALWLFERPAIVIAQNQSPACTAVPLAIDEASVAVGFFDRLSARVSWEPPAASDCASYTYQLAVMSSPTPAQSFQFSAAAPPATVQWTDYQPRWLQLRARNPLGAGPATGVLGPFQRMPCLDRPPAPEGVVASGPASIEWSPVAVPNCTVSYIVSIGANREQPNAIYWLGPTSEPKQTLSLAAASHPWYVRVQAITQMGWSGPSAAVTFDVPRPPVTSAPYPPAPANVQVAVSGRTITVTWELAEAADSIWLAALPSETSNEKIAEVLVPPGTPFTYTFDQPFTFWLRASALRGVWISAPSPRVLVEIH